MSVDKLENCTKDNTKPFTLAGEIKLAKCVKVYDGDTATFAMSLHGENPPFYLWNCRFHGYNSAEIKSKDVDEKKKAQAAKEALCGHILDKIVKLHIGNFDKYGRPLVNVYIGANTGIDGGSENLLHVNAWMLENGHGMPYDGTGEKKF